MSDIENKIELTEEEILQQRHSSEWKAIVSKIHPLLKQIDQKEFNKETLTELKILTEVLSNAQKGEVETAKKNRHKENQVKNKIGRPSFYNTELATEICQAIGDSGKKPLKWVCAENPHFPDRSTILEWCLKHADFADMYRMAYAKKLDNAHDDMLEIALNSSPLSVACDKLIVDTLKFTLAKLSPRKWGDKAGEAEPKADNQDFDLTKLTIEQQKQLRELMELAKK